MIIHSSVILPGRVLALDFGEKRIGIAISDESRNFVRPLIVLTRTNRDRDLIAILSLVKKYKVRLIVLGLPREADGSLLSMGKKVLTWGRRLTRIFNIEVIYADEFETTVEAHAIMLQVDSSRVVRQKTVDKIAAALILKRYLDNNS